LKSIKIKTGAFNSGLKIYFTLRQFPLILSVAEGQGAAEGAS
jgi:hypothetical protein